MLSEFLLVPSVVFFLLTHFFLLIENILSLCPIVGRQMLLRTAYCVAFW